MLRAALRWPGNFVHFLFLLIVLVISGLMYGLGRLFLLVFVWGKGRQRAVAKLRASTTKESR